jgi:hypothetical protein
MTSREEAIVGLSMGIFLAVSSVVAVSLVLRLLTA